MHFELDSEGGREAWSVPLAGGAAAREAPAPFFRIVPAPAGGWIAALFLEDGNPILRLVPPGQPIDAPSAKRVRAFYYGWAPDGTWLAYTPDLHSIHRLRVTGEDETLVESVLGESPVVAPDGQTIYATDVISRVQRNLIVNYGDRPR